MIVNVIPIITTAIVTNNGPQAIDSNCNIWPLHCHIITYQTAL